jgi:hypothetical protein
VRAHERHDAEIWVPLAQNRISTRRRRGLSPPLWPPVTPWSRRSCVGQHAGSAGAGRLSCSFALDAAPGDVAPVAERLACTEEVRVRLPPSPLHASVVSTASTRPLYGRGAGSIPAGGSLTPVAQWTEPCSATAVRAGSNPAGRIHADVAQTAEHPGRHSGEARSIRAVRSHRPVV